MWNKKSTEGFDAPQTRPEPPAGPVAVKATEPVRSGATIGKAVRIIGDVHSQEDLFIDGEVQGLLNVKGSKVTIGPNGKAQSNIVAREVIIQGQVKGNIDVEQKITIRKEGSLIGNIRTAGIIIDDDAYFKGSIDIIRNGSPVTP